ncbi:MAG TPA: hypothetical protein VGL56_08935 [Fimbriimonadaceae bacterium]|jgi:hypothetical protein
MQDEELLTPQYWIAKMPAVPKPTRAGAPMKLTREKAAAILANVAKGLNTRAAFAVCGISSDTHKRYYERASSFQETREYADDELLQQELSEDEHLEYLTAFFDLEQQARESAALRYSDACTTLLSGGTNKTVITRIKSRSRQAILKGEIVELSDYEKVTTEIARDRPPKLTPKPEDDNF